MQKSPLIANRQRSVEVIQKSTILGFMNITAFYLDMHTKNCRCWFKALLFLFASSLYLPAHAAVATANVTANIISTISITNQSLSGLVFGDISASSVAGTVVLTPGGSRTSTGGVTVNTTTAASPAAFDVQGDANASYAITLPISVVLTGSTSGSMVVDNFSSSPSAAGLLDGSGTQTLFVGASLNVGSNQAFGSYTGLMAVTVAFN